MHTVVGFRSAIRNNQPLSHSNAPTVWFSSWRQLAGVQSNDNRTLLRLMRDKQPRTVLELAELSGRAASNIPHTIRSLTSYGLVKLHRSLDARVVRPEAQATELD